MDTLRCRAYTRQHLRKQKREVAAMEQRVLDANQQLTAVNRENHRWGNYCTSAVYSFSYSVCPGVPSLSFFPHIFLQN